METIRQLEQSLRSLVGLLSGRESNKWRKRLAKYADQLAVGKRSVAAEVLAMYHGGMGSFLDLQGTDPASHGQLTALRDRTYELATEMASESAKLST